MSGPELEPCPFCGGEAWLREDISHSKAFWIGCDADGCPCNMHWGESKADAITAWNTRAPVDYAALPEVQALIAAAETRALDSVTTLHTVIADIRAATVGDRPMLSELAAALVAWRDDAVEIAGAKAFSAGYEAGVIVERDACAKQVDGEAEHIRRHRIEATAVGALRLAAAAIRKRGEGTP